MSLHRETVLHWFTTPKELRDTADVLEEKIKVAGWGEATPSVGVYDNAGSRDKLLIVWDQNPLLWESEQ